MTDVGKALVRACDELRIIVDLSHLNERGFDDVAAITAAPPVATHSNAHVICPSTRNLTDRQLRLIGESGGMVGLNFAPMFLGPDGTNDANMDWYPVLRNVDHLISIAGEDHVGFGSDFDGGDVPAVLGDASGLPRLIEAFRNHGFGEELVEKLASRNWGSLLDRSWNR